MPVWSEPELTTIAFVWRLDRRDGVTIGFTTHDRDLILDGLICRAAPGMLPSAISAADGFEVTTLDVAGALTDDAITADDLAAGRWDGARVRLWAVDWTDPDDAPLILARGEIGDVGIEDGRFTAELRGATALLEAPVTELTSPECRAELGDHRCRVDLTSLTVLATVTLIEDALTIRVDVVEPDDDAYAYGRLRWLDGRNSGITSAIIRSDGYRIELREPPPFAAEAGAQVELMQGCDKRLETCAARFTNAANFRGEPHLPGNDLLTRYPGV